MNQSPKLSLFITLGCAPLKEVILHHPNWMIHCGNSTMAKIEEMEQVKEALAFEAQKTQPEMVMAIEAVSERLAPIEIKDNLMNLYNDYGEIEAIKDIEASHD